MNKYNRFEEVPVWQCGIELADLAFRLVEDNAFNFQGDLRRQLGKAALSVSNNIAEGFERHSTQELLAFLYIARGSAGEVRSMMYVVKRNERYAHLEKRREELYTLTESISRQLKGWIATLEARRRKVAGGKLALATLMVCSLLVGTAT